MAVLTNLCITIVVVSTFADTDSILPDVSCKDNQHCHNCDGEGNCLECTPGYFGRTCEALCSDNCLNKKCTESENGNVNCTDGCIPGYQGTGCSMPCHSPPGGCTLCPGGCDGGYCELGSSCVSGCVDSYYGTDCKTCSSRCNFCNGTTGQCIECKQSYGGPNCEFPCKHCAGGSCYHGCFQRCIGGFYGIFCSRKCSDTCLSFSVEPPKTIPSSCNWTSGACLHGCRAGWYGPQCSYRCNTTCPNVTCTETGVTDIVDIKANGMNTATVGVNETVTFQCVVQGCPLPDVSLVHVGTNTSFTEMFCKNNTVYERLIRVHSCSQLGRYSCRATTFTEPSDKQLPVAELLAIPRKQDVKDCEIETPKDGKDPSGKIRFTLCAYPEPIITKLHFERHDAPKDITDNKKYKLTMDPLTSNLFRYTFTIANIDDEDFGVYTFTVASGGREFDILVVASQPKDIVGVTFPSVAIIIGGSLVGVPLVFVAVACLVRRRKNLSDYWNMRFVQPYLTPRHESPGSPEKIDVPDYEVIEDTSV